MKKIVLMLLAAVVMVGCGSNDGYVDLGLPSGTKWKKTDANSLGYRWDKAVDLFGDNLPNRSQWEELYNECEFESNGSGVKVTGPNGKSIFLSDHGKSYGEEVRFWSSSRCSDYPCTKFGWISSFEASSYFFNRGESKHGLVCRDVYDTCYVRLVTK